MNKNKTARVQLSRFLLLLPLLAVVLLAFRKEPVLLPMFGQLVEDTIPTPPKAGPSKLPANVKGIHINNEKVTVTLKSGEKEYYDLGTAEGKKNFEDKYGPMPEPPVPPIPPAAAVAPFNGEAPFAPAPAAAPFDGEAPFALAPFNDEYRQFLKKNSGVKKLSWISEPDAVLVHLKSGKLEVYELDNKQQMQAAEKKYGKFPESAPLPPPPPVPPSAPSAPNPPGEDNLPNAVQKVNPDVRIEKLSVELQQPIVAVEAVVASPDVRPSKAVVVNADPAISLKAPVHAKTSTVISGDIISIDPVIKIDANDTKEKLFEIDKSTSVKELDQLQKKLAERGYTLKIENVSYNNGQLESISGRIRDKNNNSYFTATEFNRIVVTLVTKTDSRKGFLIQIFDGKIKVDS